MKAKQSVLVICPGRGVYNAAELGYYARYHGDKPQLLQSFDAIRAAKDQVTIAELDSSQRFSVSKFTRGDNASGLIYACSYSDFLAIDREKYDIAAVTGNSMGWYTALACGGALTGQAGFDVVNTMGTIMQEHLVGGQIIYPIVDENWQEITGIKDNVLKLIDRIDGLFLSIRLGGLMVLAGTDEALKQAERELEPRQDRFPMRLGNHAAFHTDLMAMQSDLGKHALPISLFAQPQIPMIDGRGHVWMPDAVNIDALWDYTFGHQVTQTYDFTRAVQTGLKEFAPDKIIILGPGKTLGGASAQSMLAMNWLEQNTKSDFITAQKSQPYM
ncbi:MAG: ACP S-malonyltransferase, partial [Litorimonas sp.]